MARSNSMKLDDGTEVELPPDEDTPQDQEVDFDPEQSDIEEQEDGSVVVKLGEAEADVEAEFFENLAFKLDSGMLDRLGVDLIEDIKQDIESRDKRTKQYEEGLKRTGLGNDAPGGATFPGASRAVHPMLTKAAVDFQSRAVKEIFQPGGLVRTNIPGEITKARVKKAERKKRFFDWQLRVKIQEFRSELEKTLIQSPIAGAAYMRWRWDERLRRPATHIATVDKVIVNYSASNFYSAERITFIDDITEHEYLGRVKAGVYIDADLPIPSSLPDTNKAEAAQNKIEGKSQSAYNYENCRRFYETNVWLDDIDPDAPHSSMPYLVTVDEATSKVVALYRNWEPDDKTGARMDWIVEWPFVPWEGAIPIGLVHMIGSLSAAATGSLRALLDAAHVNNFPAAARLKGANISGQTKSLNPGEMVEIDGGVGADDVRKLIAPVTYNPPSNVLFSLLGFLVDAGENMVRTAFDDMTNQPGQQLPVGTTSQLIEQGLAVVSAIMGRQHTSMDKTLEIIQRINRMYLTDEEIIDETGERLIKISDLRGPRDVIPISDPSIPTEAHRTAQMQAISMRSQAVPQLYNLRNVEKMILERLRVGNPDDLLLPAPVPEEMNAANENAAASMGRPIAAFPEQDHLAHIQVHLDYLTSPVFGLLPIIAPKFLPTMMDHLSQHIALYYVDRVYQRVSAMQGEDIAAYMKIKDPKVRKELDRNIASISTDLKKQDEKALAKIPGIIQQAMQAMQQYQQGGPMDPSQANLQATQIREQGQTQRTQMQLQDKMQDRQMRVVEGGKKLQADMTKTQAQLQAEERRAQQKAAADDAQIKADLAKAQMTQEGEDGRTRESNESRERMNTADNVTAMSIAEAEIESSEKIDVETGSGINPNPR